MKRTYTFKGELKIDCVESMDGCTMRFELPVIAEDDVIAREYVEKIFSKDVMDIKLIKVSLPD